MESPCVFAATERKRCMLVSIPANNYIQELIYKIVDDTPLYMTFLPPTRIVRDKSPVLAVISGGGWQLQSREAILSMYASSVEQLRQAGVCIVSFDYRVTSLFPNITVAEEVGDALDAISYLHKHSHALGIDPNQIILTGHSAGGHIALLMAYGSRELFTTEYPDPGITYVGCIPFSAPCFLYPAGPSPESLMMRYDYIFPGDVYDDNLAHLWSPNAYITVDCPATLYIHGASDNLVPDNNSVRCYEKGLALGADVTFIHPTNGGHCLEPIEEGVAVIPSYEEVQNRIVAWVRNKFHL